MQDGEQTVPVTIRMTEPQKEKLVRLGGPNWVRNRIDKAREPAGSPDTMNWIETAQAEVTDLKGLARQMREAARKARKPAA